MNYPEYLDSEDPQYGEFYKETFVKLMEPVVFEANISFEVSVPLDIGEQILNQARGGEIEEATADAQDYIKDLATVRDFCLEEIEAIKRVLALDGYEVKLTIGVPDSPRARTNHHGTDHQRPHAGQAA